MFARFERLIDPFPPAPPARPPAGFFAFIRFYLRGVVGLMLAFAAVSALIAVGEVLFFLFLGRIVDWLSTRDPANFLAVEWPRLAAMAVVVLVALPAAVLLQGLLSHQSLAGNVAMRIRWLAHRHLLGQSAAFYADEFAGRVSQKMMQTALAVRDMAMKFAGIVVYVAVYFVGTLVLAASSDWWMSLPFALWLVAYVALLGHFIPRLSAISERQADARSVMTGRIVDSYTNITTVKLFSHARREEDYARGAMSPFLDTVRAQMRLITGLNTLLYLLNSALICAIAGTGVWLWTEAQITPGAIAVGIGLAIRLQGMSQWIMWETAELFENVGTVMDGKEMLSRPVGVVDAASATELKVRRGAIRFEGIRFHYGKDGGVIESLDLSIAAGEKVGLVGRSGAGKTTLMNLLLRLHDLEGGRILIDGQDIAGVTQDSLRAQIGVVTQDTALLHRSIRDNIAYGRPEASEAEIVAAARRAKAHDFIVGLVDSKGRAAYDAHVGERGVKLSGGQRQRIALARVFLKDAPILLLDEATSALDSEVEAAIQDSLFALMEGKTVIAIAHRLSTIAALDRLVVMDRGHVVETGRHEELVARGGLYASLWRRQSGGFIDSRAEAAE